MAPELIRDLARRRAVLVLGSGVSRQALGKDNQRAPTWKKFLEAALEACPDKSCLGPIRSALEENDLLHACEWIKKRFDENWSNYLRNTFVIPAYEPAQIHNEILKLDSRIVFSLNFDDIFERHVNNTQNFSHVVKNYYDDDVSEFLRGDFRYIVKIHGNLNSITKLIFTQREYSEARIKYSAFYEALNAALLTHTFLFIGCGVADPDINLLLENQNFGFPSQKPHYFIDCDNLNIDRKKSLRDNRNLKILNCDRQDDNYTGLLNGLIYLNASVETERYEITKITNW